MVALASLLVILTVSLLITRITTVALTLTGLSHQAARFQAYSAFTGVGFTTSESEKIVNHPVRRQIVLVTMLLGNVGVITTVSSLILTFIQLEGSREGFTRLMWLAGGLAVLWLAATSQWVSHHLSRLISWALRHWTDLDTRDYANLLNLSGEYRVAEIRVQSDDWLTNRSLADLDLGQEGVLVLGIYRADGDYVGAPVGETYIRPDDTLILYGRSPLLAELDERQRGATGELAHKEAIATQKDVLAEQARQDAVHN